MFKLDTKVGKLSLDEEVAKDSLFLIWKINFKCTSWKCSTVAFRIPLSNKIMKQQVEEQLASYALSYSTRLTNHSVATNK